MPKQDNNKDRGWAWMVLISTFISNIITSGFTYANGIYFATFDGYFHHGSAVVLGALSVNASLNKLIGPLATILINKFGYRTTTMIGGIVTAVGFIATMFVTEIYQLYIFYGFLVGTGIGFSTVTCIAIVPEYFEKRQMFATAFSLSGMSFGILIFPVLFHFMIEEYGWRGSMLLNSGIALNLCVCGALMRTPKSTSTMKKTLLNIKLWKSIKFNMAFIHYLLMHSILIYFIIITKYIVDKKVEENKSPLVLSIFGFFNLFGRAVSVFMGLVNIKEYIYFSLLILVTFLLSANLFIITLLKNFIEFAAISAILGFLFGIKNNIMPCTSLMLFGQKRYLDVIGYIMFAFGISTLMTPPLAGWITDVTKNLDNAMFLCGGLLALSFVASILMVSFHWKDQKKKLPIIFIERTENKMIMQNIQENEEINRFLDPDHN